MPRDLTGASPFDLSLVSRLAYKLTEDYPAILGPELADALRALRKDIENHAGEQPLPQRAPRGVFRLPLGSNWMDGPDDDLLGHPEE